VVEGMALRTAVDGAEAPSHPTLLTRLSVLSSAKVLDYSYLCQGGSVLKVQSRLLIMAPKESLANCKGFVGPPLAALPTNSRAV